MIKVIRLVFNQLQTNTFLAVDSATNDTLVIDPSFSTNSENEAFNEYIAKNNLKIVDTVITHPHIDHIQGVKYLLDQYGIGFKIHEKGVELFNSRKPAAEMFMMQWKNLQQPSQLLKEGDIIHFGESTLKVAYTPGHAEGSICFINEEEGIIFTGDLLFKGSIGRSDLPGGDLDKLMNSLNTKVLILKDDTTVYPGHGPRTTIGIEKQTNPFIINF